MSPLTPVSPARIPAAPTVPASTRSDAPELDASAPFHRAGAHYSEEALRARLKSRLAEIAPAALAAKKQRLQEKGRDYLSELEAFADLGSTAKIWLGRQRTLAPNMLAEMGAFFSVGGLTALSMFHDFEQLLPHKVEAFLYGARNNASTQFSLPALVLTGPNGSRIYPTTYFRNLQRHGNSEPMRPLVLQLAILEFLGGIAHVEAYLRLCGLECAQTSGQNWAPASSAAPPQPAADAYIAPARAPDRVASQSPAPTAPSARNSPRTALSPGQASVFTLPTVLQPKSARVAATVPAPARAAVSSPVVEPAPEAMAVTENAAVPQPARLTLTEQLRASSPTPLHIDGLPTLEVPRFVFEALIRPRLPEHLASQMVPVRRDIFVSAFELRELHSIVHGDDAA